jgi:hypothetical protein
MNEQVRAQIEAKPFRKFSIEVTDGRSIDVPRPDHVIVGFAVTIEDDEGVVRILGYRNISGLTVPTG